MVAKFSPSHGVNLWVRCASGNVYMGQFLQDGKNVRFMSLFFKKWMARAAKPSDIDDFFRFAVTYHDFGMPLK